MTSLSVASADIRSLDTALVLTGARPGQGVPGLASAELLGALGFSGEAGQLVRLAAAAVGGDLATPVLAVVGLGDSSQPETLRRAVGAALRQLGATVSSVGLDFAAGAGGPGRSGSSGRRPRPASTGQTSAATDPAILAAIAEGALLGADDAVNLVLALPHASAAQAKAGRRLVARAEAVVSAVKLARRLTNEPPNRLYPETFAEQAAATLKGRAVRVKALDESDLAKAGYGGIVAVGQGSVHPPRLVKLTYSPPRAKHHLALVGKGITFDSGGLSLKPPSAMVTMKSDMAGAAAALGAVRAASDLKLPVKLTAYLCLAENMPSGAAQRPGDVITLKDGQTVEVTNTDAEGRLVLADGLVAARADQPDQIIDIATLTGAQITALGNRIAGVMGDDAVRDALVAAATAAGEGAWAMPLPPDLMEVFKSEVADFANANLSERAGGMLSAGLFLKQFTGEVPWAHIDCAGPAFNSGEPFGYTPKGATGFGVRTLIKYFEILAGSA